MSNPHSTTHGWQRLLGKACDLQSLSRHSLRVSFDGGRAHRLRVTDAGDHWLLTGVILKDTRMMPVETPFRDHPALAAAQRNRYLILCGITVDDSGRLTGSCRVPKAGLCASEFQLHARHLAAECDRLEHLFTGEDRE